MKKWNFRRWMGALSLVLILSLLSGCSAGFWFSGQGVSDPDLVVYNDSTAVLGSISVSGERESQSVTLAEGHPLERGRASGLKWMLRDRLWWRCGIWRATGQAAAASGWAKSGSMSRWGEMEPCVPAHSGLWRNKEKIGTIPRLAPSGRKAGGRVTKCSGYFPPAVVRSPTSKPAGGQQ